MISAKQLKLVSSQLFVFTVPFEPVEQSLQRKTYETSRNEYETCASSPLQNVFVPDHACDNCQTIEDDCSYGFLFVGQALPSKFHVADPIVIPPKGDFGAMRRNWQDRLLAVIALQSLRHPIHHPRKRRPHSEAPFSIPIA
jgi:hypothetical protein